jgi:acyl-CoA synthetase (AMP-forming)/AMP-acid ligase II
VRGPDPPGLTVDSLQGDNANLFDILDHWAVRAPEAIAFRFVDSVGAATAELSYARLHGLAVAVAARLADVGARAGDRAVLVFPTGLAFFPAFFGCLYAGVAAVPVAPPRRREGRDASAGIVEDCAPVAVLSVTGQADSLDSALGLAGRIPVVRTNELEVRDAARARGDVAFLQYTSGSTSAPKGVVVRQAAVLANLEMMRAAMGGGAVSAIVSWTPLQHDMGLILNALHALRLGAPCALMSPIGFLQRPLNWLRVIADQRADIAGGPNFAFDHCVARYSAAAMEGVDLSRWRVAFNGAEPVRAATLQRFAETFAPHGFEARALYPCYGMAEATVLVSGGRPGAGPTRVEVDRAALQNGRVEPAALGERMRLVGCGRALPGEEIAIVDPDTWTRLGPNRIGEIWLRGPNIAAGYFRNAEATRETFGATIAGEGDGRWLRTGDLGFMPPGGELFIAGRLKDLIILRGVNHYPQDIEETVQKCVPGMRAGHGAAFIVDEDSGQPKLVVVQEIERTALRALDREEAIADIREAVGEQHQVSVHAVSLVGPGLVPKTTSGKIQRRLTRRLWLEGRFDLHGGQP